MTTGTATPSQDHAAIADNLLAQYQRDNSGEEQSPAKQEDRRKNPRFKFDWWQLVAEYDGENLPAQRDFRLLRFFDLSASGISFLADQRPVSDDLIIALGIIPFVFIHVRIMRTVHRRDLDDLTLQIGCRFIKRIAG